MKQEELDVDVIDMIKSDAIDNFFEVLYNLNIGYKIPYQCILHKIAFIQTYEQLTNPNLIAQKLLA